MIELNALKTVIAIAFLIITFRFLESMLTGIFGDYRELMQLLSRNPKLIPVAVNAAVFTLLIFSIIVALLIYFLK